MYSVHLTVSLLDLYISIIIDFYKYFNIYYKFCFLYIVHVIQSSDCEVFFLINDLSLSYLFSDEEKESDRTSTTMEFPEAC